MTDIALRMAQEQIEGLREEVAILRTTEAADNAQLRSVLQKLRWKSIDKDNMEFRCEITCYVMDEIRRALESKP